MFEALANHLWQSTLCAGVIGALCYWLRNDAAHIRYWLWWIASIKFLLPFSVLVALGTWLGGDVVITSVPAGLAITADVVARPFAATAPGWSPGSLLIAVWLVGSLALGARWLIGASRLRAVLKRAEPGLPLAVGGTGRLRVLHTAERIEPGIVGILRPTLLLPQGLQARLDPARLDAVLAHEIGHARRLDNLTAAAHMLVETVFWFHPLVWWIGARLVDERERACDELVVRAGHDRATYADGILDVCELYTARSPRCAAGISGSDLKRRVTQIMRYQGMNTLKRSKKLALALAGVAGLALPILGGLAAQSTAVAQQAPIPPPSEFDRLNPELPGQMQDREYLPIVKVAPIYPPRAAQRGLEGYVVVQYTVTTEGMTDNVVVLESSSTLFERAAIESAQKYKYMPRMVNSTPVAVDGVRTRIEFDLGDDELPVSPNAGGAEPDAAGQGDAGVDTIRVTAGN